MDGILFTDEPSGMQKQYQVQANSSGATQC